jgi:hypothetical protein
MRALRQLIAGLWAALWLRGRLVGLRLRRLFGGGQVATDDGPDFHRAGADAPAESLDQGAAELPPDLIARLEAMRAELLGHARNALTDTAPSRRVRRRRTASLVTAALLAFGVVGAGASALVAGTTGVASVDRLLGLYEEGLGKPEASGRTSPSGADVQPSTSKASEPIEVVLSDGSRNVTTFYVAEDGRICWAVADGDPDGSGTTSCEMPAAVFDGVRDGVYVPAIELGTSDVILRGFVRGDVASVSGSGPDGPLDVRLGEPWTPEAPDTQTLRPLVATSSGPRTGPSGSKDDPRFDLRRYAFEAVTDDGRRLPVAP